MALGQHSGKHVHLMGICGTAMASLAGLFKSLGAHVTGSDQNVYPPMSTQLEKLGIKIKEGYKKENLTPAPDLVVVGNVIRKDYDEAQTLLASEIPYTSLPKAIGDYVIEDRHSIVISGTHGKTTTTSMMAWVAETVGVKPGFLIGGIPKNYDFSFKIPEGNFFVIEGDEYDTAFFDKVPKFIHYKPKSVILTSIEFDHVDIYKDINDVKAAFNKLMELIPEDGNLIYWAGGQHVVEAAKLCKAKNKFSYGLDQGDFQAKNIQFTNEFCEFDIEFEGKIIDHIRLTVFGRFNILNALATYALSKTLNWDLELVKKSYETFKGVKRRQEIIGAPNNIVVIEDFAHHPTAVELTIDAVKERFQNAKVFALFEPRSATSRRNVFQKEYAKAFLKADVTIMPDVFNAGQLKESERLSIDAIITELKKKGKEGHVIPRVDDIVSFLKNAAKPGDVILIMSNGAFGGIYQKILTALAK
jgi:UDP-N-acetylmuramate: L-alanyl-gamma-D-glutamyl-meso-diaminopimelate ligase